MTSDEENDTFEESMEVLNFQQDVGLRMSTSYPRCQVSGWDDDDDVEEERNPHENPQKEILWAAENGMLDLVQKLIQDDPTLVNIKDWNGYSPLHRACYNDHIDVVDFLIANGANVSAQTEDKWQPLHSACRWNNARCAVKLIQHGADINAISEGGQTPLHLAATNSYAKETLQLLLTNPYIKADIKNKMNETAGDIAKRSGRHYRLFEMVEPCINVI